MVCVVCVVGTETGMSETFGSTCHGAGRAQSRHKSRKMLSYQEVPAHIIRGVVCVLW